MLTYTCLAAPHALDSTPLTLKFVQLPRLRARTHERVTPTDSTDATAATTTTASVLLLLMPQHYAGWHK